MDSFNNRKIRHKPTVHINVAPLVDVMLVLMVIFMMTSQIVTVGIQVDLPKTKTEQKEDKTNERPVVITIDKNRNIYIEEAKVSLPELLKKIPTIVKASKTETVYVRGDKELNYGDIVEIMSIISDAGICKVALIAELRDTTKQKTEIHKR
jgi:biopolymer transport protein TolR